jgi:hypothetical protein
MHSTKEFRTVCSSDPAIDLHKSNLDRYVVTRDLAHLVFHPGKHPVYYVLKRPPTNLVVSFIEAGLDEKTRHIRAFMCSTVGWQYLPDGDGIQRDLAGHPGWVEKRQESGCMTTEELNLFHPEDVLEIGAIAYQRCFLRRGREVLYTAPPTSADALQRVLSHHVAVRAASSLSSEEPGELLAPPPSETGAAATDATARESHGQLDASGT